MIPSSTSPRTNRQAQPCTRAPPNRSHLTHLPKAARSASVRAGVGPARLFSTLPGGLNNRCGPGPLRREEPSHVHGTRESNLWQMVRRISGCTSSLRTFAAFARGLVANGTQDLELHRSRRPPPWPDRYDCSFHPMRHFVRIPKPSCISCGRNILSRPETHVAPVRKNRARGPGLFHFNDRTVHNRQ